MSTNATTAAGSEEALRMRLQGLQHEVEKTAGRVKRLRFLAILLIIALILLLIALHLYHVFQYATIEKVDVDLAAGRPGIAQVSYKPKSSGKIEFVRESEGLVQTLTEYANAPSSDSPPDSNFQWSGKPGEQSSIHVTYREGFFLTTKDFTVKGAGR